MATNKRLLAQSDFTYLGSCRLTNQVIGGTYTTAYGTSGIALRSVSDGIRCLVGGHEYSPSAIFESLLPDVTTWSQDPRHGPLAPLVKDWGTSVYGDAFDRWDHPRTYGLYWDQSRSRLWWNANPFYVTDAGKYPVLGCTEMANGSVAHGPWIADVEPKRTRGGMLEIPDWFAQTYTFGRKYALGFGGPYSGIVGCSNGPCLYVIDLPLDHSNVSTPMPTQELLCYPNQGWTGSYYCPRNMDYSIDLASVPWDKNPDSGSGYWTSVDYVNGAGCWIDTPDAHGVVFCVQQGHGLVDYVAGVGTRAERWEPWWCLIDPADLADVAQGNRPPYSVVPTWWRCNDTSSSIRGCVFEPSQQVFLLLDSDVWTNGYEWYPGVHAYGIGDQWKPQAPQFRSWLPKKA